ncbi:MAG: GNAT family N-acetyltransferase [Terricaulis sp.]
MQSETRAAGASLALRAATLKDVALLERWARAPHVIAATSDDPDADAAFGGADWAEEIAMQSDVFAYWVAELDGRPIGAMNVIDPHLEPTHYWGEIEPNLRALDIWIGEPDALGKGYGTAMMRSAIDACFAERKVTAIIIDPLASNTRAHAFYKRLGFRFVGRRLFGDDDCFVFRLERQDWRKET